jgi:hypothetical protein
MVKLGDFKQAFERAQVADGFANDLVAADPTNSDWQLLVFGSAFRLGDALAQQAKPSDALEKYRIAQATVEQLIANQPENDEW